MSVAYEQVQQMPRLPFKYYVHDPLTSIDVAPHWHPEIELNFLVSGGDLTFVTNGHTTVYHPGDVWAVNRRVSHSATGDPTKLWDEFGLIIDEKFLQTRLPASANWYLHLQGGQSAALAPEAYVEFKKHFLAIRAEIAGCLSDNARLMVLSHFYAMLVLLDEHFATAMSAQEITPNANLVDAVMVKINRDFADALSSAQLAKDFHVSQTTLNQQFNQALQMPVNQYIRQVRLINARRMLLESDATIDYIATQTGFGSVKSLMRNFKAWKQVTPTAYRQVARNHPNFDTTCF